MFNMPLPTAVLNNAAHIIPHYFRLHNGSQYIVTTVAF